MKFQVFQNGKAVDDFRLSAAYMFGADAIPLCGADKIRFKNGVIECKKRNYESAGLALLWSVDGFGRVLLPTTRLPERKRPYNLNVELARAKLMQITLKREDWAIFEQAGDFADLLHQAKGLFVEALRNVTDGAQASIYADESLKKAMVFSEKLAAKHAQTVLDARCKNKTLGRHSLGCCIDPEMMENEKYLKHLFEMFGFVTIPVNWAKIEPEKGVYDFSVIDGCINRLASRRLAVSAGPLLSFSKEFLPAWLLESKQGFEKVRETAYEFVWQIVSRYASHVHMWRVISGMNAQNCFGFNFEQIIEMTRAACLAARSADPNSRKLVEILLPWGEYHAYNKDTVPPLVYTDMLIQSGIGFDAFGLKLAFGKDRPGMHIRDLMQISSMLDCYAPVPKPLHITGVAVPDECGSDEQDRRLAGFWRRQWDQLLQGEWIEQFYKIALGKPFINSISYSNLADADDIEIPQSGLLDRDFEPKKAFIAVAKLQKTILRK